jgi:cell wall-associated NlpC family hydrolase
MSIDAVVSRIGQILAMQQQLSDPAGAITSGSVGASAGAAGSQLSSSMSSDFASTLSSALGAGGQASGVASGLPFGSGPAQVQAMVNTANSLVGKPYVWGGGHAGFGPSSGYDCSGFVSAVLHAGGYLSEPADTTSLPSQPGILPGPGQYVTIYDRAQPGQTGHVIIEIDGQFYESGGMSGPWGGGGGVEKIAQPSAAYLATFDTVLHPAGL